MLALCSALLSGLLIVLALPLGEQSYLVWIALVPLLRGTKEKGFLVGFVLSLVAIFFAAWLAKTGIFYEHKNFEESEGWLYTGFGLFGFALALAVAFCADKKVGTKPRWWLAALGVLLEACLLIELPAHLALSLYRHPLILMFASVGSIWLVSYLVWLCNLALAAMPTKQALGVGAGIMALSVLSSFLPLPGSGPKALVAALQTAEVDNPNLEKAQRQIAARGPLLTVWPEFSGIVMAVGGDTSALTDLANNSSPFATSFRDAQKPLPHNVAAIFSEEGESLRYQKRKLFGGEKQMHAPGSKPAATNLRGHTIGLNICFDSCFPSIMRETAHLPGVDLIALPTIDPPSHHYFVAGIHAAFTPFRAAETGVSIVRADGYAYSMIVDNTGAIVAEADAGEEVLFAEVGVSARNVPARWLGDAALYGCGVLFLLGIFQARRADRS